MTDKFETADIPWSEKLILVCSKCGAKAGTDPDVNPSERIKTDLKAQINREQRKSQIRAVTTSCLDVCPPGRIAIVQSTRGSHPQTTATTVDPGISAEDLRKQFLS